MPEPTRWRKKPVEIEAMHYPPEPTVYDNARLHRWVNDNGGRTNVLYSRGVGAHIVITTLEGDMRVNPGDYVIRGLVGEFYPCDPDVFAKTYEQVQETIIPRICHLDPWCALPEGHDGECS